MKPTWLVLLMLLIVQLSPAQTYRFLVGTYTNTGKSQGIYTYELDVRNQSARQLSVVTGVSNPSFLCLSADRKWVYSVDESPIGSAANAFAFDADNGRLSLLNRSLTQGKGPCSIACTSGHVFTANYGGGSLSVFAREANGELSLLKQKIQHVGSSIRLDRQSEPHVHQIVVSKDYRFVLANDLGTDWVTVYRYRPQATSRPLIAWDSLAVKKGSGPRHLVFDREGKKAYLVHELDGTVSVLAFRNGHLRLLHAYSLLQDTTQQAWAADIHLSPDGKYLYASNRAPANNLTCFKVLKKGGLLRVGAFPTLGDGPRNFTMTPDGNYLLVAHQFSDNIVVFARNAQTGALTDTGIRIQVGAPVCLLVY